MLKSTQAARLSCEVPHVGHDTYLLAYTPGQIQSWSDLGRQLALDNVERLRSRASICRGFFSVNVMGSLEGSLL